MDLEQQRAREVFLSVFGYPADDLVPEDVDALEKLTQALRDVREAGAKVAKGKRNSKVLKHGMYSVQDAYNEACDDIETAMRSQGVK